MSKQATPRESPYPSILDVTNREAENLVLLYGDSSDQTWRALAFQTNQTIRRIERIDNLPTLAAGGTLDPGTFGENGHSNDSSVSTTGSDLLRIGEKRAETIMEYGLGVYPDGVLVGLEAPTPVTGVVDNRERGYAAADFVERGAVRSEHTIAGGLPTTGLSPTHDQGVVRFDSAEDGPNPIRVGFHNLREGPAPLQVLAYGKTYRVTSVEDPAVVEDMVFGEGYNRRIITWGDIGNDSPNLPKDWKGNDIRLTDSGVRRLLAPGNGGAP